MLERSFTRIANMVAWISGLPGTFICCALVVLVWAVSGPAFHF